MIYWYWGAAVHSSVMVLTFRFICAALTCCCAGLQLHVYDSLLRGKHQKCVNMPWAWQRTLETKRAAPSVCISVMWPFCNSWMHMCAYVPFAFRKKGKSPKPPCTLSGKNPWLSLLTSITSGHTPAYLWNFVCNYLFVKFRLKPLSLIKAGNQIGNTVYIQWKHLTVLLVL